MSRGLEIQIPATTGSPDSQPSRTNSTLGTWHQQDCSRPVSTVWAAHPATSTGTYSPTQIVLKVALMRPWKTGSTYANLKPGKEAVGQIEREDIGRDGTGTRSVRVWAPRAQRCVMGTESCMLHTQDWYTSRT